MTLKNSFLSHFRLITQFREATKRKYHIYCNYIKYKFDPNEMCKSCDLGAPNMPLFIKFQSLFKYKKSIFP